MSAKGQSWEIANGAQVSTKPIILSGYDKLIGVKWGGTMTSTAFGFKVSDDEDDASPQVQQWEGVDISIPLSQGKSTNFDPAYAAGHRCIWLTVGSAEGAARTATPVITRIGG